MEIGVQQSTIETIFFKQVQTIRLGADGPRFLGAELFQRIHEVQRDQRFILHHQEAQIGKWRHRVGDKGVGLRGLGSDQSGCISICQVACFSLQQPY